MDIIQNIIQKVPLPRMTKVRQSFSRSVFTDIVGMIKQQMMTSDQ